MATSGEEGDSSFSLISIDDLTSSEEKDKREINLGEAILIKFDDSSDINEDKETVPGAEEPLQDDLLESPEDNHSTGLIEGDEMNEGEIVNYTYEEEEGEREEEVEREEVEREEVTEDDKEVVEEEKEILSLVEIEEEEKEKEPPSTEENIEEEEERENMDSDTEEKEEEKEEGREEKEEEMEAKEEEMETKEEGVLQFEEETEIIQLLEQVELKEDNEDNSDEHTQPLNDTEIIKTEEREEREDDEEERGMEREEEEERGEREEEEKMEREEEGDKSEEAVEITPPNKLIDSLESQNDTNDEPCVEPISNGHTENVDITYDKDYKPIQDEVYDFDVPDEFMNISFNLVPNSTSTDSDSFDLDTFLGIRKPQPPPSSLVNTDNNETPPIKEATPITAKAPPILSDVCTSNGIEISPIVQEEEVKVNKEDGVLKNKLINEPASTDTEVFNSSPIPCLQLNVLKDDKNTNSTFTINNNDSPITTNVTVTLPNDANITRPSTDISGPSSNDANITGPSNDDTNITGPSGGNVTGPSDVDITGPSTSDLSTSSILSTKSDASSTTTSTSRIPSKLKGPAVGSKLVKKSIKPHPQTGLDGDKPKTSSLLSKGSKTSLINKGTTSKPLEGKRPTTTTTTKSTISSSSTTTITKSTTSSTTASKGPIKTTKPSGIKAPTKSTSIKGPSSLQATKSTSSIPASKSTSSIKGPSSIKAPSSIPTGSKSASSVQTTKSTTSTKPSVATSTKPSVATSSKVSSSSAPLIKKGSGLVPPSKHVSSLGVRKVTSDHSAPVTKAPPPTTKAPPTKLATRLVAPKKVGGVKTSRPTSKAAESKREATKRSLDEMEDDVPSVPSNQSTPIATPPRRHTIGTPSKKLSSSFKDETTPPQNKRRSFIPTPTGKTIKDSDKSIKPIPFDDGEHIVRKVAQPRLRKGLAPPKGGAKSKLAQPSKVSKPKDEPVKAPPTNEEEIVVTEYDPDFEQQLLSHPPKPKVIHSPINKENLPASPHSEWSPIQRKKPVLPEDECIQCTKYTYNK